MCKRKGFLSGSGDSLPSFDGKIASIFGRNTRKPRVLAPKCDLAHKFSCFQALAFYKALSRRGMASLPGMDIFMQISPRYWRISTFLLLLSGLALAQTADLPSRPPALPADTAAKGTHILNVAVNDLTAHGVNTSDAAIISERLRAELLNTGKFRVMERGQMDQILKEQAFQQSGACDGAECAVEVGKLLSVDRMVAGSVGKIGDMYTLQARLLDVQTGEVLFSVSQDFDGRIEELLSRIVPRLAERLAGATGPGGADLYVTADKPGAILFVDGEKKGLAPQSFAGISTGDHRIEARLEDLYASENVTLHPDDVQRLALHLEPGMGSLKVYSTPPGAQVKLDDQKNLGLTPLRADRIPMGKHALTLFLDSAHIPQTVDVTVPAQGMATANATFVSGAHASFRSALLASLVLKPAGGDSLRLSLPASLWLAAGSWQLHADAGRDYDPLQETFQVTPGQSLSRTLGFVHTKAWLDSAARVQHHARMVKWRWGTGVATAVAAGTATYFHIQAASASDDADKAKKAYQAASVGNDYDALVASYHSAVSRNHTNLQRAVIADVAAGLLAAGFGLTFVF